MCLLVVAHAKAASQLVTFQPTEVYTGLVPHIG